MAYVAYSSPKSPFRPLFRPFCPHIGNKSALRAEAASGRATHFLARGKRGQPLSTLPRPRAQRMCCGVHTESSADRSEMGKIDRSRRRRGCAGAPRHKICTASLDNRPLIDGFVFLRDFAIIRPKLLSAND